MELQVYILSHTKFGGDRWSGETLAPIRNLFDCPLTFPRRFVPDQLYTLPTRNFICAEVG